MAVTATFRLEQIACRMVPDPAEDISVVNAMLFGNMILAASGQPVHIRSGLASVA